MKWFRRLDVRIIGAISMLFFLVGYSVPGVYPSSHLAASIALPFNGDQVNPAISDPTPQLAERSATQALSEDETTTLNSLEQVDDYPLYTMRYYGSYEGRASSGEVERLVDSGMWGRADAQIRWGCSLFAALGDASNNIYGRNFDWDYSPSLLLYTDPPDGYASTSMVDITYLGFTPDEARTIMSLSLEEREALLNAPTLPFDGFNEKGLVVGIAAVPTAGEMPNDPEKETISSVMVMCEMLDHAVDVEEAVALMESYNIYMEQGVPLHYLIADTSGRSALVEFYQSEMIVMYNERPWQMATNFLCAEQGECSQGICWRYDTISRRLTETQGQLSPQEAMNLLADVSKEDTQWSILYGMNTGTIQVAMGREYEDVHTFYSESNDPPVAGDDAYEVDEDTTLDISAPGVLENVSDADGDALEAILVSDVSDGVLTLTADGSFTYTPDANFNGSDSFTYKANDGLADSNDATITITVNPVNDVPVADDQAVTTDEDTPVDITLTASDVDGDGLTYNVISDPSHGTLSGTVPNVTYTPNDDYFGPDSFTFLVNDGQGDSNTATVSITVSESNDPPVAGDDAYEVEEDTTLDISAPGVLANVSDADGDALEAILVSDVSDGVLTLNTDGSFTYTPDANLNGYDSFTYKANDGLEDSNDATITITVNPVNDVPVADDQAVTTDEDTPVDITLTASDVDGDGLTYNVISDPSHGTLSGSPPVVTYTPDDGYFGADSFTFLVNDGQGDSNIAVVTITVTSSGLIAHWSFNEGNGIVAYDSSGNGHDGTLVNGPVWTSGQLESALDFDGSNDYVDLGPLNVSGSGLTIAAWIQADSFVQDEDNRIISKSTSTSEQDHYWMVSTIRSGGRRLRFRLKTNGTTNVLIASSGEVGTGVWIHVAATYDGSQMKLYMDGVEVGSMSKSGSLSTSESVAAWIGRNPDGYGAWDGMIDDVLIYDRALSAAEIAAIMNPVENHPPEAQDQSVTADEDVPVDITLTATDVDNDHLVYSIVTQPAHGSVTLNSAVVTYTSDANFNGYDSFTYKANDGLEDSNDATITITVNPVNDVPVADDQAATSDEDTPVDITLTASDVEGDSLIYTVTSNPSHGTLSGTVPDVTYTPDDGYFGADNFTFHVNDGQENSNTATVSITVSESNDPPVAGDDAYEVEEDTTLDISAPGVLANVSDANGDALYAILVSDVSDGVLTLTADGSFTYTPDANFNGSDSFTYKANDGLEDSNDATITITVNPVNDVPVADDQAVTTDEDTPVDITLTASDVDGDGLTYNVISDPSHGTLSGTVPNVTYTPNDDYFGPDSFTFLVNDGQGDSNTATVSITVSESNDPPVAGDDAYEVEEDTTLDISAPGVLANVSDADGDAMEAILVSDVSDGVLTLNTDGSFTYTPDANFNGSDSFTYKANDGLEDSNDATITITVNPVNDVPVADDQAVTTDEDTPVDITLTASDVDGDGLTYNVISDPSHGTLSGTVPNVTYTPNDDYFGPDSFTFLVNDGQGDSNTATVSITVSESNDPPVAGDDAYEVDEDTTLDISAPGVLANVSDADGDAMEAILVSDVSDGVLTLNTDGSFTYTPDANLNGYDSFTYKANDGLEDSNDATITITVNPVNDVPVADDQAVTTDEDTPVDITLTASDVDGDGLTYNVISDPSHGTLSGSPPVVTYTPDDGYFGADSFTFLVNDGQGDSNIAVVTITVTSSGLIAHWSFNEGNGIVAYDSSGNGHDGTLVNGPVWTSGQLESALDFDGSNDYVDLGPLNVSGSGLTIAAWIQADSFVQDEDNRIISKSTSTSEQDHYWMVSTIRSGGRRLRFRLKTNGTTNVLIASSGEVGTGVWIHVAATYDGSQMKLYMDGVEVGSMSKSGSLSTSESVAAWIGRNPDGYGAWDGMIDDVLIYDRALSAAEIAAIMNPSGP